MKTKNTLRNIKFSAMLLLGKYPRLYYPALHGQSLLRDAFSAFNPEESDDTPPVIQSRQSVKADTDLVIEGFPRSANTSTVLAFQFAQPQSIKIAYHYHVPAQIIRAVKLGLPTLVLIRNPVDAIVSLQHQKILMHHWNLSVQRSLQYYIYFYESIVGLKHAYIVGEFQDITTSLNPTIARLNSKFNTNFSPISITAQGKTLERYHKTPYRSSFTHSEATKEVTLSEILSSPNKALLDRALAVYRVMIFD
jgi:hypothetical protein